MALMRQLEVWTGLIQLNANWSTNRQGFESAVADRPLPPNFVHARRHAGRFLHGELFS